GTYEDIRGDRHVHAIETLWLDPAVGYAPRRWDTHNDGVLLTSRTNADFEEFAPGCWLAWEGTITIGTPSWAPVPYGNQPATREVLRLRRAIVNQPNERWFKP